LTTRAFRLNGRGEGRRRGEVDGKGGADAEAARHADGAAVKFDKLADDGESETETGAVLTIALAALEPVEDAG
jgi:hypothetical protein